MTTAKDLIASAKQKMHASVETVRRELSVMRTGRASVAMLDGVRVEYDGNPTPLSQVGKPPPPTPPPSRSSPGIPRLSPPSSAPSARRASTSTHRTTARWSRVPVPPLTEERRKNLVKAGPQARRGGSRGDPKRPPRR